MKIVQIDKKDWHAGLKKLRDAYRLIGPVQDGDYHYFKELDKDAEPDLSLATPACRSRKSSIRNPRTCSNSAWMKAGGPPPNA